MHIDFIKSNHRITHQRSILKTAQNKKRLSTQQIQDQRTRKNSSTKYDRSKLPGKTYHMQTQYEFKPDIEKIYPNQITTDKQKLYSELIIIKKKLHALEDDKHKLKTRLKISEVQKSKLMMQLQQNEGNNNNQSNQVGCNNNNNKYGNNNLIYLLKQELRRERVLREQLLRQIQKIKKSVKYSRAKQLQIQNYNLQLQLHKLRGMIQAANNNKKIIISQKQIEALEYKIIQRDQQLSNLKVQCKNLKTQNQILNAEIQNQIQKSNQILNKLNKQIQTLKKYIIIKQQKIDQINKLYSQAKIALQKSQKKPKQFKNSPNKIHPNNYTAKKQPILQSQSIPQKILRIGQFLNLKLRAHHIQKQQLLQFLLPYNMIGQDKKIKKKNILHILNTDPFQLNSNNDKLQLVQYLFGESSLNGKVTIKKQQEEINKIGKRFIDIIGQYTIDHIHTEDQLFIQICQIVHNCVEKLAQLLAKSSNGQGTIKKQDLLEILKNFKFNQTQIKFILTQISLDSINLNQINYYSMFDLFDQKLQHIHQINPVQQLSQQYDPSLSNANIKKSGTIRQVTSRQDPEQKSSSQRNNLNSSHNRNINKNNKNNKSNKSNITEDKQKIKIQSLQI